MVRCFISIDLPKEVQKELADVQEKVYSEDAKLLNVKPDRTHITLRFLGEVEEEQIEKIEEAISKIKFNKFKVRLSSIGVFPNENFIRVVWAGITPEDKLNQLHEVLDKELENKGFSFEKQNENHITLARVKMIKNKKQFMEQLKKIKINPIEFEINSVILKESILTPEGPIYDEIFKLKLT